MSLSIGIVGLPNVGKSTLFNALTDAGALAANYPFATIEPNTGIVPVPDERLETLSRMYNNAPIKPATVEFVDIAGLVAGASQGEGLGNQFLANIRGCDAVLHVVRAFLNKNVIHVSDNVSPVDDIEVINTELVLADIQTVDNRLTKLAKEAKSDPKKKAQADYLHSLRRHLDNGTPLSALPSLDYETIADLHLLTAKPAIYAFNVSEDDLADQEKLTQLQNLVAPAKCTFVCAKLEEELRALDEADAKELLASYGVSELGLSALVRAAYDTLGLQSYLTAGDKEVRA